MSENNGYLFPAYISSFPITHPQLYQLKLIFSSIYTHRPYNLCSSLEGGIPATPDCTSHSSSYLLVFLWFSYRNMARCKINGSLQKVSSWLCSYWRNSIEVNRFQLWLSSFVQKTQLLLLGINNRRRNQHLIGMHGKICHWWWRLQVLSNVAILD